MFKTTGSQLFIFSNSHKNTTVYHEYFAMELLQFKFRSQLL